MAGFYTDELAAAVHGLPTSYYDEASRFDTERPVGEPFDQWLHEEIETSAALHRSEIRDMARGARYLNELAFLKIEIAAGLVEVPALVRITAHVRRLQLGIEEASAAMRGASLSMREFAAAYGDRLAHHLKDDTQ